MALRNQAIALYHLGFVQKAKDVLKNLIKLDPNNRKLEDPRNGQTMETVQKILENEVNFRDWFINIKFRQMILKLKKLF